MKNLFTLICINSQFCQEISMNNNINNHTELINKKFMDNSSKNLLYGLSIILYYLGFYLCYQYGARFQSFLLPLVLGFPALLIIMILVLSKWKEIPIILLITHILTMIATYIISTMMTSGPM